MEVIECRGANLQHLTGKMQQIHATLQGGGLLALPTDTVYGIGALAFHNAAVRRLLGLKGRGQSHPCPVLVGDTSVLDTIVPPGWGRDLAFEIAARLWPGALSLVLPLSAEVDWHLHGQAAASSTLAVRQPAHPVALEVLTVCGPLAVTSANRHGQAPATTCTEAQNIFGSDLDYYLDAGSSLAHLPSTIIDLCVKPPRVLRLGAIGIVELKRVLAGIDPMLKLQVGEG